MSGLFLLIAVVAILIAANIAMNHMSERFYVLMAFLFSVALFSIGEGFGLSMSDFGLARSTWITGATWAAVCIVAVALVHLIGAMFKPTRALYADDRATELKGHEVARRTLLDIPLGTVLLEEVAFRGVLFGMLLVRYGSLVAIIGTSVLFGLWHVLPAIPLHKAHRHLSSAVGNGIKGRLITIGGTVLATTAAGLGFAVLRWWTGSILPGIGLHWALNGFGVLAAWWIARHTGANRLEKKLEAEVDAQVHEMESTADTVRNLTEETSNS